MNSRSPKGGSDFDVRAVRARTGIAWEPGGGLWTKPPEGGERQRHIEPEKSIPVWLRRASHAGDDGPPSGVAHPAAERRREPIETWMRDLHELEMVLNMGLW